MAFNTENHPGVSPTVPKATQGFVLNHSMLRVKDPVVSLDFYTRVMGMRALRKLGFAFDTVISVHCGGKDISYQMDDCLRFLLCCDGQLEF